MEEGDGGGQLPDLLDWLSLLLTDPEFVDAMLWLLPSAIGISADAGVAFGCGAEFEAYGTSAYVFNWRSGQLSQVTGADFGAYLGTPRVFAASAGVGSLLIWGAGDNEVLEGFDIYYGVSGGADFLGSLGFDVTESKSLAYEDVDGDGWGYLQDADGNGLPDFYVDPDSGMQVTTLQVSANAGFNAFPNAVDLGAVAGVSATPGVAHIFTIPGWENWGIWPWNWSSDE
jgi:hypothetical protein